MVALIQSGFWSDIRVSFGDDETETVKHHGRARKTEIGSDSCGCLLGAERLWIEGRVLLTGGSDGFLLRFEVYVTGYDAR